MLVRRDLERNRAHRPDASAGPFWAASVPGRGHRRTLARWLETPRTRDARPSSSLLRERWEGLYSFRLARIRLFLELCSTSARPSASSTGGTYIPKRPRNPFFRPYQPFIGLLL